MTVIICNRGIRCGTAALPTEVHQDRIHQPRAYEARVCLFPLHEGEKNSVKILFTVVILKQC